VPNLRAPDFFPILSLLPQRSLVYIKAIHADVFVETFIDICSAMWENSIDVSKPELLAQVLGKKFEEQQVRDILGKANSAQYKGMLNTNTKEALEHGAFGCPWFWVRNAKGDEEPFFGSDRYDYFSLWVLKERGMVAVSGAGNANEASVNYRVRSG
jgi:glutathione S-transferase kappa 1